MLYKQCQSGQDYNLCWMQREGQRLSMCVLWRNMISTTTVGNTQGRKYQLLNGQGKVEVGFVLVSTKGAHSWSKLLSEF